MTKQKMSQKNKEFDDAVEQSVRDAEFSDYLDENEEAEDNKIWEIELYTVYGYPINKFKEMALALYKEIYHKVLKDDPQWHLFYENSYNIIRFTKRFRDDVIKYLDLNKVEYKEIGVWRDDSSTVNGNFDIYKDLFHSFSILAIRNISDNIDMNLDRVIHCFLNHQFLTLDANCIGWEEKLVSNYLVNRSFYTGRCYGITLATDWYEKRLKEEEETE